MSRNLTLVQTASLPPSHTHTQRTETESASNSLYFFTHIPSITYIHRHRFIPGGFGLLLTNRDVEQIYSNSRAEHRNWERERNKQTVHSKFKLPCMYIHTSWNYKVILHFKKIHILRHVPAVVNEHWTPLTFRVWTKNKQTLRHFSK